MSQAVSLRAEPFKCICGINGLGPAQQAKRQLRPLLTGIDIESEKYNQNATSKLQLGDPFATLPTKSLNGCLYCIWCGKGSGGWLSNLERTSGRQRGASIPGIPAISGCVSASSGLFLSRFFLDGRFVALAFSFGPTKACSSQAVNSSIKPDKYS